MFRIRAALGGTAAATGLFLILAPGAAQADITPEQVWDSWQAYYKSQGYTLHARDESLSGQTLILNDVTASNADSNPDASVRVTLDHLEMAPAGDGSVRITLPSRIPVISQGKSESGAPMQAEITLDQSGQSLVASGSPDQIAYDFSAASVTFALTQMTMDGKPVDMTVAGTLENPTGHGQLQAKAGHSYSFDMKAAGLDLTLDAADPKGEGKVNLHARLDDIASRGTSTLPEAASSAAETGDLGTALMKGLRSSGDYSFGHGDLQVALDQPQGTTEAHLAIEGASGTAALASDGLDYHLAGKKTRVEVTGPELPAPVSATLQESGLDLGIPLSPSEQPRPVKLGLRLVGLDFDDAVWSVLDPQGKLSHDPATLVVKLSGMARLAENIFAPGAAEAAGAGQVPPAEVQSLDLDQLDLRAGGAELTGKGGFTFDNSDTTTIPGWPRPQGKIDLRLTGGNKLIDALVSMGLVGSQQAMAVRMMLGLFANAGPGEDELQSTLEFRENGGFYANGQRLR